MLKILLRKVTNSHSTLRPLSFLVVLFLSFACYSQQVEKDKIYFISADQTRGTFQFEVTDEKFCNVNVTAELMEEIEKNRHNTDFKYISISKNCRIKIYPKALIQDLRKNPLESCLVVNVPVFEN